MKLEYLNDSNAAAHSTDSDIFYSVICLQLHAWSMWRCDKDRDKKAYGIWWSELCLDKNDTLINIPFTTEITKIKTCVGVEI